MEKFLKLKKDLLKQMADIECDSRFLDKPALVHINAPLALIQVELKSKYRILSYVLNEFDKLGIK